MNPSTTPLTPSHILYFVYFTLFYPYFVLSIPKKALSLCLLVTFSCRVMKILGK